jgi:hypothetical protein
MTRTGNHRRWLRITSAALFAATLGISSAATANAVNDNEGQGAFLACYKEAISHAPHDPPTQEDADIATHDCCLGTGGAWSTNDYHHGFCIWPPTDSESGGRPTPGTRVAVHPDPGRLAY